MYEHFFCPFFFHAKQNIYFAKPVKMGALRNAQEGESAAGALSLLSTSKFGNFLNRASCTWHVEIPRPRY